MESKKPPCSFPKGAAEGLFPVSPGLWLLPPLPHAPVVVVPPSPSGGAGPAARSQEQTRRQLSHGLTVLGNSMDARAAGGRRRGDRRLDGPWFKPTTRISRSRAGPLSGRSEHKTWPFGLVPFPSVFLCQEHRDCGDASLTQARSWWATESSLIFLSLRGSDYLHSHRFRKHLVFQRRAGRDMCAL